MSGFVETSPTADAYRRSIILFGSNSDGKAVRVPKVQYLERLSRRNEYLIWSHHPLRETLIAQTGATPAKRRDFLQDMDAFAIQRLLVRWGPSEELRAVI